jgi:valyl-tRNA synthetase
MVSSYGLAVGKAAPSDQSPLARNTSEKFDVGRNFANKLWNAARFGMGKIAERHEDTKARRHEGGSGDIPLVDRWIVSRLAAAVGDADGALERFEFKHYADGLYDFIWRDFCDWYIEAIKPTIGESTAQQQVLAAVLDVILRLLHPVMPYITEMLWQRLGEVAPQRGLPDVVLPAADLLVGAEWPRVDTACRDAEAESHFERIRQIVGAIRQVRTTSKVPPRREVPCSARAPQPLADLVTPHAPLITTLASVAPFTVGPDVSRPDDAAATLAGGFEIYVHGLVDRDEERRRLGKQLAGVRKSIAALQGRLNNKGYTDKAPAHLVQQTREQLESAEREAAGLERQMESLK